MKEREYMNFIDMHTHSTASDGLYTPSALVDYAIEKGLSGIAITDHDTIDGIEEAIKRATQYNGFIIVPGIELSAEYNNEEVHILGYMIDYKMESFKDILKNLQERRNDRARKIIKKLNTIGFDINYEDILGITQKGAIGRPHIARILVAKGYVKNNEEAFEKYLVKGCPAYVPREKLSPEDAIDIIKMSGGFSVIAHPGLLNAKATLDYLLGLNIDGIEVYHSDHTLDMSKEYLEIAKKNNLLITGGSDFHFPPSSSNHHGDLASIKIPLKNIQQIF